MNWLRNRLFRRNGEHGSAVLVWLVVLIPVFFSLAGAGIDVANAVYTRTALQTSLDAAAQSALTQATNGGGATPQLTKVQAQNAFVQFYGENLDGDRLSLLNCAGTTSKGNCGFDITAFNVVLNSDKQVTEVDVTVHQSSTPLFLNAFNILPNGWQYNLTTSAHEIGTCTKAQVTACAS